MTNKNNVKLTCVSRRYDDVASSLDSAIRQCKAESKKGGLLHIAIDNLPMVISSQGGEFAENMMDDLTRQVKKLLKAEDSSTRTDKDHIHVILQGYSAAEVTDKAMEIYKAIQNYGCLTSLVPIQLTSTVGAVTFPDIAESAPDAINKAYIALNDARESFMHYVAYGDSKKHQTESRNQMVLASYIQTAFFNNKLRLAYQPIVNAKTGDAEYYECLLRVLNEDGSISSAGPFIPVAERMGFIELIDAMVLQMAVKELQNCPTVKLSVNVSHVTIHSSDWLALAARILDDPKISSRLVVEITETSEFHDIRRVSHFVSTVQSLGCKISLDDFGSGYTSFSQLKLLPIDMIKIDGSFVRNIVDNAENRFFVKTLLEFSRTFHLKAVAEFVENKDIVDVLTAMDVDFMQGNYFSPAVNHREWLK